MPSWTAKATSSGGHGAEFTGFCVSRCAAFQISAYCISPRLRADDPRHHARFEIVVEDVAARKPNAAGADRRQLRVGRVEAVHVMRRVAGPALAADILIEPAVAVGDDVEPATSCSRR